MHFASNLPGQCLNECFRDIQCILADAFMESVNSEVGKLCDSDMECHLI